MSPSSSPYCFSRSHMCAVDGTPRLLVCPDSCAEGVPFSGNIIRKEIKTTMESTYSFKIILCLYAQQYSHIIFPRTQLFYTYSMLSLIIPFPLLSYSSTECGCRVDKLVNNETTWQNLLPCVLGSPSDRYVIAPQLISSILSSIVPYPSSSLLHHLSLHLICQSYLYLRNSSSFFHSAPQPITPFKIISTKLPFHAQIRLPSNYARGIHLRYCKSL